MKKLTTREADMLVKLLDKFLKTNNDAKASDIRNKILAARAQTNEK